MQKGIGKLTFIMAFGSKIVFEPPAKRVVNQTQEVDSLLEDPTQECRWVFQVMEKQEQRLLTNPGVDSAFSHLAGVFL